MLRCWCQWDKYSGSGWVSEPFPWQAMQLANKLSTFWKSFSQSSCNNTLVFFSGSTLWVWTIWNTLSVLVACCISIGDIALGTHCSFGPRLCHICEPLQPPSLSHPSLMNILPFPLLPLPLPTSTPFPYRHYSASIILMAGFPDQYSIWLATVPGAANFAFTIIGLLLVQRLSRRKLLIGSVSGTIVGFLLLILCGELKVYILCWLATTHMYMNRICSLSPFGHRDIATLPVLLLVVQLVYLEMYEDLKMHGWRKLHPPAVLALQTNQVSLTTDLPL